MARNYTEISELTTSLVKKSAHMISSEGGLHKLFALVQKEKDNPVHSKRMYILCNVLSQLFCNGNGNQQYEGYSNKL